MRKIEKLYFKNEDSTHCALLEYFINEAKEEGLDDIELIEAIPAPKEEHVWCTYHGETVERNECIKSECDYYSSKSGRGVCEHRGSYYLHGDKAIFKVPYIDHISGTKPLSESTTNMLNKMAKQVYKTK